MNHTCEMSCINFVLCEKEKESKTTDYIRECRCRAWAFLDSPRPKVNNKYLCSKGSRRSKINKTYTLNVEQHIYEFIFDLL